MNGVNAFLKSRSVNARDNIRQALIKADERLIYYRNLLHTCHNETLAYGKLTERTMDEIKSLI